MERNHYLEIFVIENKIWFLLLSDFETFLLKIGRLTQDDYHASGVKVTYMWITAHINMTCNEIVSTATQESEQNPQFLLAFEYRT